ncbi:MAG: hypothetical protein ACI910_003185 [Oleispira sp.]|jgi:hypothetical protein
MKYLMNSMAIALALVLSAGANAKTWGSDPDAHPDGESQFNIALTGDVPQRCRIVTRQNLLIELDLDDKGAQASKFKFKAWCNTGSTNGNLVVGGFETFQNERGNVIPLAIAFNGANGRIETGDKRAFEQNMQVSNATDGSMGPLNTLKIKPVVNGFEDAGNYTTSMYVALYPR